MSKTFKTPKGTELPILNLRGKDYLEVKYRLVWFREEHPQWSVQTEFVSMNEQSACARAAIVNEEGRTLATSHKFESVQGFPDFLEKAETGAIGRALALIGYGTQFCADELDEGERLVDSPVTIPSVTAAESAAPGLRTGVEPGEFRVPFGRKYRGKKLNEIPEKELQGYMAWLEADAAKKSTPLSFEAKLLKKAIELYLQGGATEESGEEANSGQ